MNGISIDRAYNTPFLGVMIDDQLNWKEHIKIIQSKQLIVLISKGSFTIVNIFSIVQTVLILRSTNRSTFKK